MLKLYTFFDHAVEIYMRPFIARAHGEAIREFSNLVNHAEHPIAAHPDHYTLFFIGEFDEQRGKVVPSVPHSLGNGVEFLEAGPRSILDERRGNELAAELAALGGNGLAEDGAPAPFTGEGRTPIDPAQRDWVKEAPDA